MEGLKDWAIANSYVDYRLVVFRLLQHGTPLDRRSLQCSGDKCA